MWVRESLALPSVQRNATGTLPSALMVRMNSSCFRSAVRLGHPIGDHGGAATADAAPAGGAVAATEADRGGVVVELVEAHAEALPDGQDELGEQCAAVGIEQTIQRAPEPVVAEQRHVALADAEHAVGKTVHRLLLAIDGLALDDDGAQQHAQCAGVGDGATPIRGHEARQRLVQPDALDEVVDQGQRAQSLGAQSEACLLRCGRRALRARHAGDRIVASNAHVKSPCRVPSHSASSKPARRSPASAPRSPRSSTCARARCTGARRCAAGRLAAAPRTRSRGTARTTNGDTSRAASSCTGWSRRSRPTCCSRPSTTSARSRSSCEPGRSRPSTSSTWKPPANPELPAQAGKLRANALSDLRERKATGPLEASSPASASRPTVQASVPCRTTINCAVVSAFTSTHGTTWRSRLASRRATSSS